MLEKHLLMLTLLALSDCVNIKTCSITSQQNVVTIIFIVLINILNLI